MKLPLKFIDRTFWGLYFTLLVVAVLALFSASSSTVFKYSSIFGPVLKQSFFLFLGLVVAAGAQYVPTKWLRYLGYPILAFAVACLYLLLIPNSPFAEEKGEAVRWFRLNSHISFQPSELAKFGLILVVTDLLSRIRTEDDKKRYFLITLGITAFTAAPVLPYNLSTTVLIVGVVFLLWYLARIPWKLILTTMAIALTLMVCGYFYVKKVYIEPHRKIENKLLGRSVTWVNRVDAFLEHRTMTEEEFRKTMKEGDGYQRSLANAAVVLGGKSPIGVLPGNSQQRDFLPVAHADYIFSIIVEETGFVGACLLIFLYLAILFRACYVSTRYSEYGSMLMMMGMALMLTCQAFISMAVAVGLGPVTGQPLPLISAGGTSALITSLYFGFMFAVAREQNELQNRQLKTQNVNKENDIQITFDS